MRFPYAFGSLVEVVTIIITLFFFEETLDNVAFPTSHTTKQPLEVVGEEVGSSSSDSNNSSSSRGNSNSSSSSSNRSGNNDKSQTRKPKSKVDDVARIIKSANPLSFLELFRRGDRRH